MTPGRPRPLQEADDRASFDCGRDSLNVWLRRHAWHNHASGASRVYVSASPDEPRIAGFIALSAGQIGRGFLPKPRQRNQPDPLPVILLGQLAVDRAWQGRGLAASLLAFALRIAVHAADSIGSFGVLTHPLDDTLRAFCARWGFEDLPGDPRLGMLVRTVDLRASGA